MKLFPASGPLEFAAMDLLGPFKKNAQVDTFVLVITNWFTKTQRCIQFRATTAATASAAIKEY